MRGAGRHHGHPALDRVGAAFARFGLVAAAAAAAATFVVRGELTRTRIVALSVLSIAALAAQLATSHAAAQVDSRVVLLVANFLHMGAAAAWVGGIPFFLLVLYRTHDGRAHGLVGRRFSALLIWTVAVLVAAGLVMAVDYVGSIRAIYGSAYGVMVATKVVLLVALLFFGAMNNRIIERMTCDPGCRCCACAASPRSRSRSALRSCSPPPRSPRSRPRSTFSPTGRAFPRSPSG